MKAHIDFETFSVIDLKEQGLDVYAKDESTDILCMAYAIGEEAPELWIPGMPFPFELELHMSEGGEVWAHNAPFEWSIWNYVGVRRYGWPELKIEQLHCNMAAALCNGLPGSLEKLALILKLEVQKDMAGSRTMLQLSKPRKVFADGTYTRWEKSEFPEKYEHLYSYCILDVNVERASGKHLKLLSDKERAIWLLDFKINQRGIKIDLESVSLAENIVDGEKIRLDSEMRSITGMQVSSCNAAKQIKEFLQSKGLELDGISKSEVVALLDTNIDPVCRRVLELRQEAAKSSTAKLSAMRLKTSSDGRIRNTKQYAGANATQRWAGRGAQFDNLPRPSRSKSEIENVFDYGLKQGAEYINIIHGPPTSVISDCLRGMATAEDGNHLIASDWSNIEGRVLSWLADETWKIKAFNDFDEGKGEDIYRLSYSAAFHMSVERVTPDERQIGKVLELSMGFQGGVRAFHSMAKNYGVNVTDERADELKKAWRFAHPKIVSYWHALESAALSAVQNPGKIFTAGPADHRQIKFRVNGNFLECRMPSGRCLHYFRPELKKVITPWDEVKEAVTYLAEDSVTRQLARHALYGGLITENITQATARDILAESLLRLEDSGYFTVMHIHDEIVVENAKNDKTKSLKHMSELMCSLPAWANGLPINAGGWTGPRYRK